MQSFKSFVDQTSEPQNTNELNERFHGGRFLRDEKYEALYQGNIVTLACVDSFIDKTLSDKRRYVVFAKLGSKKLIIAPVRIAKVQYGDRTSEYVFDKKLNLRVAPVEGIFDNDYDDSDYSFIGKDLRQGNASDDSYDDEHIMF